MELQSVFLGWFSLLALDGVFPCAKCSCDLSDLLYEFAFGREVERKVTQTWLEKQLLCFQTRQSVGRELCRLCT